MSQFANQRFGFAAGAVGQAFGLLVVDAMNEHQPRFVILCQQRSAPQGAVRTLGKIGRDEDGLHVFGSAIFVWSTARLNRLTIIFSISRMSRSTRPGRAHCASWTRDRGRVSNRSCMKGT